MSKKTDAQLPRTTTARAASIRHAIPREPGHARRPWWLAPLAPASRSIRLLSRLHDYSAWLHENSEMIARKGK